MRNSASARRPSWPGRLLALHAFAILCAASGALRAQCNLDVDGNGVVDPLTDGLLIRRVAQGLTGSALTQGALGPGATVTDPNQIIAYVNANKVLYDLDGSGTFDPQTDGLMMIRYMFGMTGNAVTASALGNPAPRSDWGAISGYLQGGCASISADLIDAARLLTQATWGPKYSEIFAVTALLAPKADSWITAQFALPRLNHTDFVLAKDQSAISNSDTVESFWTQALSGPDQLRQRVVFALAQILVVSDQKDALANGPYLLSGYLDTLSRNAFGNFRTLLEEMTKTPAMGLYLDHMCNDRDTATRLPNENYAREIMQLFSIGTLWLNQNGTLMLDNQVPPQPIPTYDQSVVQGFAKVFTGWSYSGSASWCAYPATNAPWYNQMIAFNNHHSYSAKTLLAQTPNGPNATIAAATSATANAQADLTFALDNIFNHPNVGPYIGKQLIHFLVTSNPTPEYVSRVAAKFNDNGSGVRGDMKAVIRAILTDTEARDPAIAAGDTYGKLREPAVRFGNLMRTFHATATSGRYNFWELGDTLFGVNQQPLSSPTVFNFFDYDYAPQGTLGTANLLGPEFEITTSTSIVATANNMTTAISGGWGSLPDKMVMDYPALSSLAAFPNMMADYLNLVMTTGAMTAATRTQIINAVTLIPQTGSAWQSDRWKLAIFVLFNSPEYVIQR